MHTVQPVDKTRARVKDKQQVRFELGQANLLPQICSPNESKLMLGQEIELSDPKTDRRCQIQDYYGIATSIEATKNLVLYRGHSSNVWCHLAWT